MQLFFEIGFQKLMNEGFIGRANLPVFFLQELFSDLQKGEPISTAKNESGDTEDCSFCHMSKTCEFENDDA